jgi:ABC-type siderophore export system fused ATPase/permease subunit
MKSILLFVAYLVAVFIIGFQQSKIKRLNQEMKSITNVKDSLYDELFNARVMNGRYELTLDHLQEVNPKTALEFVNYMNHETE